MEVARQTSSNNEGEEPQKGCWKIDLNDEACYIDVDVEDDILDPNHIFSEWHLLPNLLLEEIFSYLDIRQRYWASLVCRNWYACFYLPRVWSNFLVDDQTLTRQRYNYYSGWQHTLDHLRTQSCLTRVGRHIKGLDFRPEHSFNNLFQFMTLVSWCIEQGYWEIITSPIKSFTRTGYSFQSIDNRKPNATFEVRGIGSRIKKLNYLFPCNMASPDDPDGIKLFGTGGQLLAELKRLLGNLGQLRQLQLTDLMLDRYEAKHLLDEVLQSCQMMLRRLSLVNVTTVHCPIMHVGLFLNLQTLIISPQNIDDDVLLLFADSRLEHLHILQNCYTPSHQRIEACSVRAWRTLKRDNPKLMVHLRVESLSAVEFSEILWQPEAPVHSVLYRTPKQMARPSSILRAVDLYKNTLAIYGFEQVAGLAVRSVKNSDNDNDVGDSDVAVHHSRAADDNEAADELHKGTGREGELRGWRRPPNSENIEGLPTGTATMTNTPSPIFTSLPWLTTWPDFDNRIDSVVVLMARQMSNLGILMLRDPVSTSSLLLIAKAASNLQRFYVLRDAVRCDCDWPANPEWTSEFYEWLCCASSTIPNTEQAMSQMLQYNWRLLSPEEYHKVAVNVRQPVMYNRKHQNH